MSVIFDNFNDYFSHANISAYNGITGDIAVSAWVRRNSVGGLDVILAKTDNGATTWEY